MSLEKCLTHWEIPMEKVLQIISDNGANMVKAVNMLREGKKQQRKKTTYRTMRRQWTDVMMLGMKTHC